MSAQLFGFAQRNIEYSLHGHTKLLSMFNYKEKKYFYYGLVSLKPLRLRLKSSNRLIFTMQ
jgi:hypothetical protein